MREEFDPTAEYVVSGKGLLFGGRSFEPGEPFDVPTTERMKRRLYDGRWLERAPIDRTPQKIEPTYIRLAPAGDGLFHVYDTSGNMLNSDRLDKDEALELIVSVFEQENTHPEGQESDGSAGSAEQTTTPATQPGQDTGGGRAVVEVSPGWYNVTEDGKVINDKKLRRKAAEKLAAGDE